MDENPSMPFASKQNPLVTNQCIIQNFLKQQTCSQGGRSPNNVVIYLSASLPSPRL